jgi:hypothetical protein
MSAIVLRSPTHRLVVDGKDFGRTYSQTMNTQQVMRHGAYIAATAEELAAATFARRWAAAINQRVLFGHRGNAELSADGLVLRGWKQSEALTIERADITGLRREFTRLYGRFLGGGSAEWGAPIIISRVSGPDIYLLFDHRAFLEKSSNVEWHVALLSWRQMP